jgi:transglutaminase-like putative cysteine protease
MTIRGDREKMRAKTLRILRGCIFLLVLLAALPSFFPSRAEAAAEPESWYVIAIGGNPAGYVHDLSSEKSTPEGEILVSSSEMKIVINRLGSKAEIEFITSLEETVEGDLTKVRYEMRASLMSTKSEAAVKDQAIEIRTESGGKSYARAIHFQGELLGQEGIRLKTKKGLVKPGDIVEFQTFAPELESVTKGSRKFIGRETLRIGERDVSVLKAEETVEAAGEKSTVWLDADFEVVKQEMPTPFGMAEIVLSDKARALAAAEGEALPAELFKSSLVRSNIRIPKARDAAYLKLKLTRKNLDFDWPDIENSYQKVVLKSPEALVVEIRRPVVPQHASFPAPAAEKDREYLEPNAYVQSDDPGIQNLARKIIGGEKDMFAAALKLERWVSENMKFDLGIVLAPASEIYRSRRGTCLGYATLLAALARAAGIPSRVAIGYVYAQGIFGGHAWTEIKAGSAWIPLDAAIVSNGVADAARISFGSSSLYEGAGSLSGKGREQLFFELDIRILEYAMSGGGIIEVPPTALPYRIKEDIYENPWLGLTLKKPETWTFTKLDAGWPDATVVRMEGPERRSVELQEHYLNPWRPDLDSADEILAGLGIRKNAKRIERIRLIGFEAATSTKASLVLIDEPEAWVLIAEGKNADKLLDEAAVGLEIRK